MSLAKNPMMMSRRHAAFLLASSSATVFDRKEASASYALIMAEQKDSARLLADKNNYSSAAKERQILQSIQNDIAKGKGADFARKQAKRQSVYCPG